MQMIPVALGLSALALAAACAPLPPSGVPGPSAITDRTTMDERAALAVEVAYAAVGALVEAAADAGRLRGATAARVDALDAEAARYVRLARAAYDAGNADGYAEAVEHATPLLAELRRIVGEARP